ncbi:MFS transporter [Yoonia sp. 2307UL14-13]|uniref:MFS transporter n=1 Tax=Yoonia sp. 2307UL14-13 TaxID=3126506 RepID=UPI0030B1A307
MSENRALIPTLSAANFIIGMGAFVLIGMLTPISEGLGISPARTGWIMTTYALAYAVLSPVLVSLTGKVGRRRLLTFALGIFAAANLLSALAVNEAMLHTARILAAAGAGVLTPVTAAVASGLSNEEERGRVLAAVFFGLTLAQVLGVPLGSWIAYTFGWRAAFAMVFLLALPVVALLWQVVPAGLAFQVVSLRDLGQTLRNGRTMLAVLFTTTFLGGIYVVYTYLAPLLEDTMGYGRDGVTLVLIVFGIGAVGGNILGGWLADRIGPFRTLLFLACMQALIMPTMSLLPLPDLWLFMIGGTWSIFGWSFMAAQQVRIIGMSPQSAPVVLALNAAAIYVGAAIGSAIGSAVISAYGLKALGVAGGLVALCAVVHIAVSEAWNRQGGKAAANSP